MSRPTAPSDFMAYTVQTASGPHITMQAGVVFADRVWTTTASDSLKARSVRKHRWASAVLTNDDGTVTMAAGPTEALEPGRLFTSAHDPLAALAAGPAVLGIAGSQLRQLVGYLEAASVIPASWLPHRRVLLATRIDHSLTLRRSQLHRCAGLDQSGALPEPTTRGVRPVLDVGVPDSHRALLDQTRVHVAFENPLGPMALPATRLDDDRFAVSAHALRAIDASMPGRAAAVFDDSADRRPDRKLGVLLRGHVELTAVDGAEAILTLTPDRVTTWDGFGAHTSDVPGAVAA